MRRYWPRRAGGLPPGQRLLDVMPRLGDLPHRPPPQMPAEPRLEILIEGQPVAVVTGADLQALGPREHVADFHCVTTWSVTGLAWTGVALREVLASVGITHAPAAHVRARSGDRRRVAFLSDDVMAADVVLVLATHLDRVVLGGRHGGLLRLVSPGQYGYKSLKHLVSIDFRARNRR